MPERANLRGWLGFPHTNEHKRQNSDPNDLDSQHRKTVGTAIAADPMKRPGRKTKPEPGQNKGGIHSPCAKSVAKSRPLTAGSNTLNPAMTRSRPLFVSRMVGGVIPTRCLGGDVAKLDGGLAQADMLLVCGFRDFGRIVVADLRREGGYEHQRIVDVTVDGFAVRLDAPNAVLDEAVARIGEQFDRM